MSGAFEGAKMTELRMQFRKQKKPPPPPRPKLTEEEILERRRQYYKRTREARLARAREYRATHKDKIRAYNKQVTARRRASRDIISPKQNWCFSDLNAKQRRFYAAQYSKERKRYMYFAEYQALARRTQNLKLSNEERFKHAMFGMQSELGEIAGIYQKECQGHRVDAADVIYELGDLLWFMSEFCDVLGFDLEDVAKSNIQKLKQRYPHGFEAERSLHREEE